MPTCYAAGLGDCDGKIEDEHFVSRSLQRMFGAVDVAGLAWQRGASKHMQPGSYAHSRVICRKHHDALDGLDGNALAYFRNLMLIANPNHISTGIRGRAKDITPTLDGRGLERWFMKTICGAIAAGTIEGVTEIPPPWIGALFTRTAWPENWAMYVEMGARAVRPDDGSFHIEFHWSDQRELNGLIIRSFAIVTLFSIVAPDGPGAALLRRPRLLGAAVQRPDGGEVLDGLPAGQHIRFALTWPGVASIAGYEQTSTAPLWRTE